MIQIQTTNKETIVGIEKLKKIYNIKPTTKLIDHIIKLEIQRQLG